MVSPIAREIAKQEAGDHPGQGRRQEDLAHGLGPGRPETERSVAQAGGHCGEGVVGQGRDERDDHDPHDRSGGEGAFGRHAQADRLADLPDERRDRQRGEEAVDHRRHAGQDLHDGLDRGPETGRGVFRKIDRRQQSDRSGNQHRDDRDEERPDDQRDGAELPFAAT